MQVKARTDGASLPDDLSLAAGRPGLGQASEVEKAADAPDDASATYDEEYAEQGARTGSGHHPPVGAHEHEADGRAADDLLPRPVGRRREHPRQERPALRHDQRRLRAPHGQRQRLHRGPGAGDPAQHLRLPREVPRLERHRLQLPRRPVRPDLGGPLRRHRQAGRGRAHAQLQRLLLRDVGHRQLRDRPADRRDAAGLRPALRVEAVAARGQPRVDLAEDRPRHLPGHQRPPRRRLDRLPGQVPLRPAPADPAVRRPGGAGRPRWSSPIAVSEPNPQNNLDASPYPDLVVRNAADGRGLVIPTGGLTVLPAAHGRRQEGLGQALRRARLARPHR